MSDESTAVLRSSAKINLSLEITGVREDGYHLIQSLFCPISLYDEIQVSLAKPQESALDPIHKVTFRTSNGTPLDFQNDTVSQALWRLKEAGISLPPLEITITKAIPSGGGLGGGSSNAATVLKFLYERFAPVKEDSTNDTTLQQISLKVGADVPFFLKKGPALVTGIGEVIKPISLEPFAVLVCTPNIKVLTKEAFSWFDQQTELTRHSPDATKPIIEGSFTVREVVSLMKNDLEKPVESRHPEIGILKKALRQWGALGSLMSGSGSSVYGLYKSLSEAKTALEKLQPSFPSPYAFFACETLN